MLDLNGDNYTGTESVIDQKNEQILLELCKWDRFLTVIGFYWNWLNGAFHACSWKLNEPLQTIHLNQLITLAWVEMSSDLFTPIYLLMDMVYFLSLLYPFRFATKTKSALHSNDLKFFNSGFDFLQKQYTF